MPNPEGFEYQVPEVTVPPVVGSEALPGDEELEKILQKVQAGMNGINS